MSKKSSKEYDYENEKNIYFDGYVGDLGVADGGLWPPAWDE